MAKRKQKKKASGKDFAEVKHSSPDGFWRQSFAFLLGAVLAPLITLAIFGLGGSLPGALFDGINWLLGLAGYIVPVVFIYVAVKIFKSDEHKLPRASFWGLLLFLMSISGLLHLSVRRNESLAAVERGEGGGLLGHLTDSALYPILDRIGTVIVLLSVGLIAGLFILQIPLKEFFLWLLKPFRRSNQDEIPEGLKSTSKSGFKLNEGVPIEKGAGKLSDSKDLSQDAGHNALTTVSDPDWVLPGIDLLSSVQEQANPGDVEGNAEIIKATLAEFNIDVEMEEANVGPRVTQYTLKPPAGVHLNRIVALDNELSLKLAAESIRMEAPIPGKQAVGVEVPNKKAASVRIHSIIDSKEWKAVKSPLAFVVGKDIAGNPVVADLDIMPHLLVAGQTGSGKSVMINTLLTSFLYRNSPSDLKMILVDPKRVELKPFDEIPHLLTPVITEPDKTISALKWAVAEMERRYKSLEDSSRRNIYEYNQLKKDERMPYIIIVIDELAELMMMAARDVEALVVRLAQKSRAVGIHLVLATQRPSVNVITGLIKANVPARIAFTTVSQIDSRTIIDKMGAEKLLGTGDMLFSTAQMSKPKRIQGALIDVGEVEKVTDFIRNQRAPEYDDDVVTQPVQLGSSGISLGNDSAEDNLYEEAVQLVVETGKASTSFLQRRFSIGYTRAARLIDMMEAKGVVAAAKGNKPREVLVGSTEDVYGNEEIDI